MMRTSHQPLAHLVDAAAEQWLAAEHASEEERLLVQNKITRAFRIGERSGLTFHGLRFLLIINRAEVTSRHDQSPELFIKVHEIARND